MLDLGNGRYAMYAHLRAGSVVVAPGAKVSRGQVIGKVGNTGNTSAPHLHFQMMDGASPLGSEGIPYVLERFALAGRIEGDVDPSTAGLDFRRFRAAAPSPASVSFRSTWTSSTSAAEPRPSRAVGRVMERPNGPHTRRAR